MSCECVGFNVETGIVDETQPRTGTRTQANKKKFSRSHFSQIVKWIPISLGNKANQTKENK